MYATYMRHRTAILPSNAKKLIKNCLKWADEVFGMTARLYGITQLYDKTCTL